MARNYTPQDDREDGVTTFRKSMDEDRRRREDERARYSHRRQHRALKVAMFTEVTK